VPWAGKWVAMATMHALHNFASDCVLFGFLLLQMESLQAHICFNFMSASWVKSKIPVFHNSMPGFAYLYMCWQCKILEICGRIACVAVFLIIFVTDTYITTCIKSNDEAVIPM
jgi:hypothetical protein